MYNDTVIGLGVILLFLIGAGLLNFYEARKRRKLFLERMIASWAKIPQREYSYEELDHISQFFRQKEKEISRSKFWTKAFRYCLQVGLCAEWYCTGRISP